MNTIRPTLTMADSLADLQGKPRTLSYRVRRALLVPALAVVAALTGCATDMSKYYEVQGKAIEADNNVVMAMAAAAAGGDKGALMWLALRKPQGGQIAVPQDRALQWASILVPAITNIYGINRNAAISMQQIEAETQQYTTTMGTLGAIANKGMEEAGKVTFPPVYTVPLGSAPAPAPSPVPTEPIATDPPPLK